MSVVLIFITACFAENPIIQTSFTADPAPMVYNDTLILYTGDDSICTATTTGFYMRYWKCYTTTDMANWTYRAMILPTSSVSWSSGDANAGQCIARNGKFYFYYPTGYKSESGACAIGVAVATSPYGPFTDIGQPLVKASVMTGCNATHSWRGLDPTVYIDDDGQAYMYWGNNVCYWVKLNADMISYSGSVTCIAQNDSAAFGPDYEEAPWIYKRSGKWYLLYASSIPENIGYTMSTSPTGPWTYKSIISKAPSNQNGNHPGYIEYKGNPYLFSFKDKNGLPNATNYRRSICVEKFTYNADGTIPSVTFSTAGAPQIGHLNPYDTTQAETICWSVGLRAQPCGEGGMDIDSIHNGDYIMVKGVDFGTGAASFDARVASAGSGGSIEIRLDTLTGTLIGTCAVSATGGWQTWTTKSCTISGATGVHNLYLKFTGGSGMLFNFNWWKFNLASGINTSRGKSGSSVTALQVVTNAGKVQTLRLDFSSSIAKVNVCLFDLSGRVVATLFNGQLSSQSLSLPLNRTKIRNGAYLIRASVNGETALTKIIVL